MKRVFTEEHKQKLSEAHKGKIPSNLEQLRLYRKGRPLSEEHKKKIADAQIGKFISEETRIKIGISGKGRVPHNKGIGYVNGLCKVCKKDFTSKKTAKRIYCSILCYRIGSSKENHYKWIDDRTKLSKTNRRDDSSYKEWRKNVYHRDNFICKINNKDCLGRIEAHHILSWKDYIDLRYDVSNGITLCKYHHPKTRKLEKNNIKFFQSLII